MVMTVYLLLTFSGNFKKFKEGREEIVDDQCPSHPSTSKTDANTEKVSEIVRQNRHLSIRAVAELINTDKETVRQILHNNFNMKKVCSKTVLKLLTPERKEIRMNICADILQNNENDPNILENVITCDEPWFLSIRPRKLVPIHALEEPQFTKAKESMAEQIPI